MVGPKKQAFCPKINILKGNFDTNYLWSSVVGVVKGDYFDLPCEIFEILCELDVTHWLVLRIFVQKVFETNLNFAYQEVGTLKE